MWVAFCLREEGPHQRYTVTFEPLPFAPEGDADADAAALMGAYGQKLEEAVKAAPEQYFWQHRRWKKRPVEEPVSDG